MTESYNSIIPASVKEGLEEILSAVREGNLSPTYPEGYRTPSELFSDAENAPILLGFSGGADSSVLLFFTYCYAKQHNIPLRLVHLHHGIRGEEADRDAAFAKEIAALYDVPLTLVYKNVPAVAKERGESIETAARRIRYEVFEAVMREQGIEILLTAHSASDQLETVLFHLFRGSGLSGLCGIPPVRALGYGHVVRPLLEVSREEIEQVAAHYGIPFVKDSTNSDTAYTRNRLRMELVPVLREITPTPEKAISRLTASLRRDKEHLEREASVLLSLAKTEGGLDRTRLLSAPEPVALRALLCYWQSTVPSLDSYSSVHLEALLDFARNGRNGTHLSLPKATASLENGLLSIKRGGSRRSRVPLPDFTQKLSDGETAFPHVGVTFFLGTPEEVRSYLAERRQSAQKNDKNIYNLSTQIAFSFDTIDKKMHTLPLTVRPRKPGDRIFTRGMHRSLRTLCNEAHLSSEEREHLTVVTSDDEILWIPGLAVRDGFASAPAEGGTYKMLLCFKETP